MCAVHMRPSYQRQFPCPQGSPYQPAGWVGGGGLLGGGGAGRFVSGPAGGGGEESLTR